jgi:hypothetical protein
VACAIANEERNGATGIGVAWAIRPLNAIGRASGARLGTDRVANVLPLCPAPFTLDQAGPGTPAADPGPLGCTPSPRRFGENQ